MLFVRASSRVQDGCLSMCDYLVCSTRTRRAWEYRALSLCLERLFDPRKILFTSCAVPGTRILLTARKGAYGETACRKYWHRREAKKLLAGPVV